MKVTKNLLSCTTCPELPLAPPTQRRHEQYKKYFILTRACAQQAGGDHSGAPMLLRYGTKSALLRSIHEEGSGRARISFSKMTMRWTCMKLTIPTLRNNASKSASEVLCSIVPSKALSTNAL
jgi:hypothetical protein